LQIPVQFKRHSGDRERVGLIVMQGGPTATIGNPVRWESGDQGGISAPVFIGARKYDIWFRTATGPIGTGPEPFLIAALLPAMVLGGALQVDAPVSPRLLASLPKVQEILATWDRQLRPVPINADARAAPLANHGCVSCFFSGGVDSWYSLLKHRAEISTPVFVHGFDIPLENTALRARVSRSLQDACTALGMQLLEVETNVRDLSEGCVSWELYHGAAMASVAHVLGPRLRKIYIAASTTYANLVPNGTHPILDPLWSTESTELVHDGCEAAKMEKVARVAACDAAVRTRRVCYENPNGDYNCGRCRKCLNTMVSLRLVGALERCPTFAHPLDLEALGRIRMTDPILRARMEDMLQSAEDGADTELVRALRNCLSQKYYRGVWRVASGVRRRVWRRLSPD
jgi:hypothetical protein